MIVLDASVANPALLDAGALGDACRAAIAAERELAVPALFYTELLRAIAGSAGARGATPDDVLRADLAAAQLAGWRLQEVLAAHLVDRVWELRHNVSVPDAMYVAAAEHLGCPLLTRDARLAKANGPRCEFRLVPTP